MGESIRCCHARKNLNFSKSFLHYLYVFQNLVNNLMVQKFEVYIKNILRCAEAVSYVTLSNSHCRLLSLCSDGAFL